MKVVYKVISITILSIFCFTACDNEPLPEDIDLNNPATPDPGTVNVTEAEIIGTWELSDHSINIDQAISVIFEGEQINSNQVINVNQQSGDVTISFTDNGEYTSEGSVTAELTGTQDGVSIPSSTDTIETPFSAGTWSVSDGVLTMTNSDGSNDLFIIAYSGNTMVLFTNENLPVLSESFSNLIPDPSELLGLGDIFDLDFDIEQELQAEFNLSKVE
jgi:hypothetical protein